MILEALFNAITRLLSLIPFNIPALPDNFNTALNFVFNGITSSLGIIDMFINLKFWLTCAGIMLVIYNIKHIWNGIVFCLNLIPSVNISYWK